MNHKQFLPCLLIGTYNHVEIQTTYTERRQAGTNISHIYRPNFVHYISGNPYISAQGSDAGILLASSTDKPFDLNQKLGLTVNKIRLNDS